MSSSDLRLSWSDVRWVKQQWGGKLILKGIMEVEDALLAPITAPTPSSSATTAVASSTGRSSIAALPAIVTPWATGLKRDGRRHP